MPKLAQYNIEEVDLTHSTSGSPSGVYGVLLRTERGEINNPKRIISSWPNFIKYYGNIQSSSEDAIIAKKALEGGAQLRVCRIGHYTDINNASTLDATLATMVDTNSATFSIALKAGDSMVVTINGTPTAAIPFTVSHNNTMKAIALAIVATFPTLVEDCQVVLNPVSGSNNRTLVIGAKSGATITVNSIVVSGTAPIPTVTVTTLGDIVNSLSGTLLTLTPKAEGAAYNKLVAYVMPPSNKQAGYFDLTLKLSGDNIQEPYVNLQILPEVLPSKQSGLTQLSNSAIASWSTPNLSGVTDLSPLAGIYTFATGTDGTSPTDVDFIGASSTKTGLNAFDNYADLSGVAALGKGISSVALSQAITAYAENRKDLVGFLHINNTYTTEGAINAAIDALAVDSSYIGFYGGGNITTHPVTGDILELSELGDVLALAARTHTKYGSNYSFAGRNRGILFNSTGPVTNFGTPAMLEDFKLLAANRANMVINRDNKVYLWGNFTGQKSFSVLSYMNIRFLILEIKKTLAPMLEDQIEEPNLPSEWKKLYLSVRDYLGTLTDRKALYGGEGKGWDWQGDQFAKDDLSNLTVNNANDVGLGKYKILLFLKPVPTLQEIQLSIVLTKAGVSFEESLTLL